MRRIFRFNIKDTSQEFKAELYRNRHEKIADIPNDYIGNVKRELESITEFSVNIPKYVQVKDKKKMTPLYMKIKPMQHIIVTTVVDGVEKKERFVLIQHTGSKSKNNGSKTFKAMAFEYTLKKKRTSFEGKVIQLKKDNIHIAEGILDKFSRETGWGIDYVDPKSRTELMSATEKINVDLFKNYSKSTNVTEGGLLFEKNITTTIEANRPLYISFEYTNFKTYSDGKLLLETPAIYNTLTDALYTNIKKVQAYHYSDVGNRYGIRYVFTLTDNTTVERISVFTNIINKTFTCENIRLVWETGNIVSTENVKYINIESLDTDWYEALRSLQDNFKSVFLFDSYNKTVSVVHRDNLGEEKPYILTYDNAIIDIEVTENSDYITGLKVMGKDGLSIVSENIYGDDIVRNYSEYIRLGNMSEELQVALQRYEALLTTKQEEWLRIKDNSITESQKQVRIDSEIQSLQFRVKDLKGFLADYMSKNDISNQARIKGEIDGLESRLNQCLALRLGYRNNIENLNNELMAISSSIDRKVVVDNKGKIFTDNDLAELNDIEQIGVYEDDYYSNSFSLLNASKKALEEMIKPLMDFNINCANLCKIIQNKRGWNYILQLGSLFKFDEPELKEELGEDMARLVGYEYNPKTDTISNLIFTNKVYKYNIERNIADLGKKAKSTDNMLNSLRPIIDDAMMSNNFVGEVLKNGLDMSAYVARGKSISNYIEFNEAGLFMYDQSDMNRAIYIGSSLICITNDKFQTSETAISSEGILAKLLVGSVILGEKLYITSTDGSFYVGNMNEKQGFGLNIKDGNQQQRIFLGTEVDSDNIRRAKLRLLSKDGREVVLDENGIIQTSQFIAWDNVSPSYPMRVPYVCDEGVYANKRILMTLIFEKYRAFERGMSSGGTVSTSSSGGGGTSGAGGGQTSSTGGYGTSSYNGAFNLEVFTGRGTFDNSLATIQMASYPNDYYIDGNTHSHGHTMNTNQIRHTHEVIIKSESHSHTVYGHSHQVYDHTHTIQNHAHVLDTTHNHQLEYAIHEQNSYCSNVRVYVNDTLVRGGINQSTEVDITSYIKINSTNNIRIETDSNGRITCNIFTKAFVGF